MAIRYETNDRTQALDPNQVLELLSGSAWISGLDATASNGNMTVDLTAGDALVDGAVQSPAAGSVTISAADPNLHRKDLIYVDSTGALAVAEGTPDDAVPAGTTHEHASAPAPPDGVSLTGTPIWEVWVAAGTTSIATADLRDRRVSADVVFNSVTATTAEVTTSPSTANDVTRKGDLDSHASAADAHHAQDHAARHAQGGADVIDAADLSGASGTNGQVLKSDGTAAFWGSTGGNHIEAKTTPGSTTEESVSWTTAFSATPVAQATALNTNATAAMGELRSVSTTGATVRSVFQNGNSAALPKHVTATESS